MEDYKIDPKKLQANIAGVRKTRIIWVIAMLVLAFPIYYRDYVGSDTTPMQAYLYYFFGGALIAFWLYSAVLKTFDEVKIELSDDTVRVFSKREFTLPLDRVRFIREASNGFLVFFRWGRRIWVPKSIRRYDEFKAKITERVDPEALKWTKLPTLWLWIVLCILGLAFSIYFKDLIHVYTVFAVSIGNISYLVYFE